MVTLRNFGILKISGWLRFGAVMVWGGTVRAVPVFGSSGASREAASLHMCFGTVTARTAPVRANLHYSGGSGSTAGSRTNGSGCRSGSVLEPS